MKYTIEICTKKKCLRIYRFEGDLADAKALAEKILKDYPQGTMANIVDGWEYKGE